MEIFISIDGVLRNTIQKFDYHYQDYFLFSDPIDEEEPFEYGVVSGITKTIDNLTECYKFHTEKQYLQFLYFDFPIEIFAHSSLSYKQASVELNSMVFENKDIVFTLVGLFEKAKAKPATFFFLSKNGIICDSLIFSSNEKIDELWKKCDLWITDNKTIIDKCPAGKKAIKFNTEYNNYFTHTLEINKISEINKEWLIYSEKTTQ